MWQDTLRTAKYVCFGGCAIKGVSYLGCLRALQQHHAGHAEWHRQLRGACGSSSGCLAALAFLVDADAEALLERWRALHIESVAPCMDLSAVFARYGVDGGHEVKRIIREVFAACGLSHDTTFRTLHRLTHRDLRICVTNLNRLRREIFSHLTTPDVVVSDAIYWSMTVPFVFQPETYKGDLMVDGCMLDFVPHDQWPVEDTLFFYARGINTGVRVDERREIVDVQSFATGVLACCSRTALRAVQKMAAAHPDRFVFIDVNNSKYDAVLTMDLPTFEAVSNLGYATVMFRLFPELASACTQMLRMSISLQEDEVTHQV